ncbi:MAG: response regulator [Gammaproteobacteria bacterium]|nr:response regulator [Gammaproteobacteria bacterium]
MKLWSLKNKYILIVDDFAGMRTMLRNMLSPYRPEHIAEAMSGEEALKAIQENDFDIILCDYNLGPGKDGQQILEEIKERELIPYSSIYVMTTAENTSEMVMGAVEYSPDDYLSKPFTKEVLISRLKKLIKRKSSLKKISVSTRQRDYESAIHFCDEQLSAKPINRFELLKIKAELLLRINDYDSVEKLIKPILEEREIPWALLYLGKAHYYRENYDEARFIFEDLIEDHPNYLFAHDWLAKLHRTNQNYAEAQKILEKATIKSPKAIKRQQTLAEISFENKDYDTSEKSYKRITRTGKNSYYLNPNDYFGLAEVYLEKDRVSDALDTISDMRKEFSSADPLKNMKSHINEAFLYDRLQREKETNERIDKIISIFSKDPGTVTSVDSIELAKLCYSHDRKDDGNKFIQYAIKNNHDNQETIDEIISLLTGIGLSNKEINALLKSRDEVIEINNRGVKLATTGKISESISLFVEAAMAMPENHVINLNTAQSLIMHMNKSGATETLIDETKKYLDKVKFTGKPSEKYKILTASWQNLAENIG